MRYVVALPILGLFSALSTTAAELREMPTHRYCFKDSGTDGARLADAVGDQHGKLLVRSGPSRLSGDGQLILDSLGWDAEAQFPGGLLKGSADASVELWYTPKSTDYDWHIVFRFDDNQGNNGDFFWYALRRFQTHRVEIADDGLNENIQRGDVPFKVGERAHLVVTYDADGGHGGRALVRWFVNGRSFAEQDFGRRLSDLDTNRCILGPTKGVYDEFRIYDYPLSADEVKGNYEAGPDELRVRK